MIELLYIIPVLTIVLGVLLFVYRTSYHDTCMEHKQRLFKELEELTTDSQDKPMSPTERTTRILQIYKELNQ